MSKKKSMAWGRKQTGHISTGVLNYGNVERMGRNKGKLSRSAWKRRKTAKAERITQDQARQSAESHIDFNQVRIYLDLGMTLAGAKQATQEWQ